MRIFIVLILFSLTIYSQEKTDSLEDFFSDFDCNYSDIYNIDSLLNNPYLLFKPYKSPYLKKEDSLYILRMIDTCYVYKMFVKKEKQIEQYRTMIKTYNFPDKSKIIELKELKESGIADRAIVYWIENPKVNINCQTDEYDCSSSMIGHGYYYGEIKFSLLNLKEHKIINTIDFFYDYYYYTENAELKFYRNKCNEIPFSTPLKCSKKALSSRVFYNVIGGDTFYEGETEILTLDDYNGDGSKLEFALYYASGGCMGTESTLIGYSKNKDKLIHYPMEIKYFYKDTLNNELTRTDTLYWLGYTFTLRFKDKKLRYQIDYRGRGGCLSKYDLLFDDTKDCFIGVQDDRQTEYLKDEEPSWISLPEKK